MHIRRVCALQETSSVGMHDVLEALGVVMHYKVILKMVSHLEVFQCEDPLQQSTFALIVSAHANSHTASYIDVCPK